MNKVKKNKKIVFDDTDIRHAKLKIRLQHDGLSQAEFFRAFVTGYIEKDGDIIKFINDEEAVPDVRNFQRIFLRKLLPKIKMYRESTQLSILCRFATNK